MTTNVNAAFHEFMVNHVNLDKDQTSTAKGSRGWLVGQIQAFPGKTELSFPKLYSDVDIYFGSFERKTKIRELDDIDIMIGLSAEGGHYNTYMDRIEITVLDSATELKALCYDGTNNLNSRKVVNKFVSALSSVEHYKKAEIHRQQEAATLNLSSYAWCFDIVPAFFTKADALGKSYYLIPDGNGYWKKTDPRIDRQRVVDINQKHSGRVYNAIRIMKYWNRRPTMPSMPSYLLECMLLNYYASKATAAREWVDMEATDLLYYIYSAVYYQVQDPKGIQGELNQLSDDEKSKISARAYADYLKAAEARQFETNKDHESSIKKWREVFGNNFPDYG
jgi:hypothetical protein